MRKYMESINEDKFKEVRIWLERLCGMEYPSIAKILRNYGYQYEANTIDGLVRAAKKEMKNVPQ
jgi:hypothetical protein